MTTITAETAPRSSFREVWLISAGHMMTHWYPSTFYLLLPAIGASLGLSFAQIGSILTVQYGAGAISNIPGGMVVDAVGRLRDGPLDGRQRKGRPSDCPSPTLGALAGLRPPGVGRRDARRAL